MFSSNIYLMKYILQVHVTSNFFFFFKLFNIMAQNYSSKYFNLSLNL